jgi:hypothetical protein
VARRSFLGEPQLSLLTSGLLSQIADRTLHSSAMLAHSSD